MACFMCVPCLCVVLTFNKTPTKQHNFKQNDSKKSGFMSSADYKKPRKIDFPQCAKDALTRIGKTIYLTMKMYMKFH